MRLSGHLEAQMVAVLQCVRCFGYFERTCLGRLLRLVETQGRMTVEFKPDREAVTSELSFVKLFWLRGRCRNREASDGPQEHAPICAKELKKLSEAR